jgi:hypothetical protein
MEIDIPSPHSNEPSDDEDSAIDVQSIRQSTTSSMCDNLSLARTISTASSVSTIAFSAARSIDSLIEEDPVFGDLADDSPPKYADCEQGYKMEVPYILGYKSRF